jgi:hypothetical protein
LANTPAGAGNQLPQFTDAQVILTVDQAGKILIYIFPNDSLPNEIDLEAMKFAQGLLAEALKRGQAMGVMSKLLERFGGGPAPITVKDLIGVIKDEAKVLGIENPKNMLEMKIYKSVRDTLSVRFRPDYHKNFKE